AACLQASRRSAEARPPRPPPRRSCSHELQPAAELDVLRQRMPDAAVLLLREGQRTANLVVVRLVDAADPVDRTDRGVATRRIRRPIALDRDLEARHRNAHL